MPREGVPAVVVQDALLGHLVEALVDALVDGVRSEAEWRALRTCVQHLTSKGVTLQERLADAGVPDGTYRAALARVFGRAQVHLRRLGYG